MSLACAEPERKPLNLASPAPLAEAVARLARRRVSPASRHEIQSLAAESDPRRRVHALCEVCRKLDAALVASHLETAARLALDLDPDGLRFLLGFLEVKRPGVEVLHQIEALSSLERVGLKILSGSWSDPEEAPSESAALVAGALHEAREIGALERSAHEEPGEAPFRQAVSRLRAWFRASGAVLEAGRQLPPPMMRVVIHLAGLETTLLERRLSRIASRIDPYDSGAISRLMPVVSFYDQDIEHLKSVVSRLDTYRPFHERLLTLEQALSEPEMDAIVKRLSSGDGAPAARLLSRMRQRPLLDREFAFLTAALHQLHRARAERLGVPPPDILSVMIQVVDHADDDHGIEVAFEPDLRDELLADRESRGILAPTAAGCRLVYREDRAADFVEPDGLPRLAPPAAVAGKPVSIKDLVMAQMANEPFLLGLLENPRATGHPGVIPAIVMHCRSVRVLSKIASLRRLHSGPANKDVPRLLLLSPVRVPVTVLKPLIHVRFISRVDLERLNRSGSELRSEVRNEIKAYLNLLKK